MKRPEAAPARLLGLRPADDPAGMARLVRSSVNAPRDVVPPLKGRIRSTLRRRSAWRRRYVRAGVIGVIIFLAGGVVGAMVQPIIRFRNERKVASVENVHPTSSTRRRGQRPSLVRQPTPESEVSLDEIFLDQVSLDDSLDLSADLPPTLSEPLPDPTVDPWKSEPSSAPSPSPVPSSSEARPSPPPPRTLVRPSAQPIPTPSFPRPSNPAQADAHRSSAPTAHAANSSPRPSTALASAARDVHAVAPPPTGRRSDEVHPALAMLEPPPQPGARAESLSPPVTPPRAAYVPPPPRPAPSPAPAASAVAPAAPAMSAPASEQTLLSRALHSLRSQRRPDDALTILDTYAVRFPNGSLAPEAARLRTEALLALGQKPAALAELNRDLGSSTMGAEENRLVRGELHAGAGRWRDALSDFDAVARARLAHEQSTPTSASAKLRDHVERALWGRASARSHLGDHAGAAADLREYLLRFPHGRFAAQAGHLLGELR